MNNAASIAKNIDSLDAQLILDGAFKELVKGGKVKAGAFILHHLFAIKRPSTNNWCKSRIHIRLCTRVIIFEGGPNLFLPFFVQPLKIITYMYISSL